MAVKNKDKIEALLKTYSAKDISKIFIQIDERLVSLHECSANDFSQLNKDFKNLFNQLKVVSENIHDISEFFNQKESVDLFSKIKLFCNNLYSELIDYKYQAAKTNDFISKLSEQLELLFFPVKNSLQNLMILRYLFTNLKILIPTNVVNKKEIQLREKEINLISEKISRNLNSIQSISSTSYSTNEPDINKLGVLLLNIIKKTDNLEKRYIGNRDCFVELKKKKLDAESNISDIVKKLQYHDIIRQKMEHIQKTHQDLIDELNMFDYSDNDEKHLIEKAKFFLKIRDVAGIQAAQLIQANSEYQSAIETIVNNFVLVLDNIEILRNTCKENHNEEFQNLNIHREIVDEIEIAKKIYGKELENCKTLTLEILNAEKQIEKAEKFVKGLQDLVNEFFNEIEVHVELILKETSNDESVQKTIAQINNVINELKSNVELLSDIIKKLNFFKNNTSEIADGNKNMIHSIDFNKIKEYVALLKKSRDKIDEKLEENKLIGSSSLKQIKKSISEIKYYDFFEKVIEEITRELNTINYKLKEGSEFEDETLSDNLNMLKEYYTVETEHSIHEQLAKGEDINVESKDDGEIEFF
jgi:hypothetical protein